MKRFMALFLMILTIMTITSTVYAGARSGGGAFVLPKKGHK